MSWASAGSFLYDCLPSASGVLRGTGDAVHWVGKQVVLSRQSEIAKAIKPYTKKIFGSSIQYLIGGVPGIVASQAAESFCIDAATYTLINKMAEGVGDISNKAFLTAIAGLVEAKKSCEQEPEPEDLELKELPPVEDGYKIIKTKDLEKLLAAALKSIDEQDKCKEK